MEQIKEAQPAPQESETPISIIERAEKANRVLEENIKKQEEILKRQEEVAAKQLLSGRANAGTTITEKKEETPSEYKNRILRGG